MERANIESTWRGKVDISDVTFVQASALSQHTTRVRIVRSKRTITKQDTRTCTTTIFLRIHTVENRVGSAHNILVKSVNRKYWQRLVKLVTDAAYFDHYYLQCRRKGIHERRIQRDLGKNIVIQTQDARNAGRNGFIFSLSRAAPSVIMTRPWI